MPRYTFFTQGAKDRSSAASSPEELVNCYAEIAPGDGRTRFLVRSVPGEVAHANVGSGVMRAFAPAGDYLYTVSGGSLQEIREDQSVITLGAVGNSLEASISGNNGNVTVVSGGTYYVWNGSSLTTPSGAAFTSFGSVAFMDYDTILTELNGRRFTWSDTADPSTLDALDFASAEARDGNILRAVVDRTQLYLFCTTHVEVWYNTGASGANRPSRYQRLNVIDTGRGLKGYHLVAQDDFGVFHIGNDNVAYITRGTGAQAVSTPAVQTDLAAGTATACGYYEDRGHKFCTILFSDRPAWTLDLTTSLWHRRQTGPVTGEWRARRIAGAWGNWYSADDFGDIRKMHGFTDDGYALSRIMRGKPLDMQGRDFSVAEFEVGCAVGETDIGRDAEVMLRTSWDGGKTWSAPDTASIGDLGDYDVRASFYALGRGDQFTPEVSITENAEVPMYSDARIRVT